MLRVENEIDYVCIFLSWTVLWITILSEFHLPAFVPTCAPLARILYIVLKMRAQTNIGLYSGNSR